MPVSNEASAKPAPIEQRGPMPWRLRIALRAYFDGNAQTIDEAFEMADEFIEKAGK